MDETAGQHKGNYSLITHQSERLDQQQKYINKQ